MADQETSPKISSETFVFNARISLLKKIPTLSVDSKLGLKAALQIAITKQK